MAVCQLPFGRQLLLPRDPAPLPILAQWAMAPDRLIVTFDQQLQAGTTDKINWSARHNGFVWESNVDGNIVGDTVTLLMMSAIPLPGENCSYFASVGDVMGLSGVPVAAFTEYPIT